MSREYMNYFGSLRIDIDFQDLKNEIEVGIKAQNC